MPFSWELKMLLPTNFTAKRPPTVTLHLPHLHHHVYHQHLPGFRFPKSDMCPPRRRAKGVLHPLPVAARMQAIGLSEAGRAVTMHRLTDLFDAPIQAAPFAGEAMLSDIVQTRFERTSGPKTPRTRRVWFFSRH